MTESADVTPYDARNRVVSVTRQRLASPTLPRSTGTTSSATEVLDDQRPKLRVAGGTADPAVPATLASGDLERRGSRERLPRHDAERLVSEFIRPRVES